MDSIRSQMPLVVELRETCSACPSQWEGRAEDGRWIYIRYRFGLLRVGVGDCLADAVAGAMLDKGVVVEWGGPHDGTMDEETMKWFASTVLRFED
jgi:hypothetical protein